MSNYKVRSRDLVDIVNDINSGSIVLSPFFQRKLVWRLAHKVDFIETILKGFPFPEIFISRGTLDVDTMKSTSCVVDGQQRMSTIREFLKDGFDVEGKRFSGLDKIEKEAFLKYEVAIIDLDLNQDDPSIIEIFKRLNRTFYALSNIEKLSTEFGSSEFMLVAKMICGEFFDEETPNKNVSPQRHKTDPNISPEFIEWANQLDVSRFKGYLIESEIFTKYEVSRQVHLMFTLNLMATMMVGFYARNEQVVPHLETYSSEFPSRDTIVHRLVHAAQIFSKIGFPKHSAWYSKSNAFSLLLAIDSKYQTEKVPSATKTLRQALTLFVESPPDDYSLAAREAVNNKRQRILRNDYIEAVLNSA